MSDPNGQLRFDRLASRDDAGRDRPQRLGSGSRSSDQLLKPEEVRLILNVSRSWLSEAANAGRIPSIRLGPDGPLRFDPDALERWLERRGGVTPAS
jgi:predicted DNA-binding transcriptional regulator AlpA